MKHACFSRYVTAAAIADSCAASICNETSRGATAHNADTDFTGVNVKSKPATAVVFCRPTFATHPDSSRSSAGARPYSFANIFDPTSVRIRARSASSIEAFHFCQRARLCTTNASAHATRYAVAPELILNARPNFADRAASA